MSKKLTNNIPDMLSQAIRLHQLGKLDEAESLYINILSISHNHPDALHLLGLIALHKGENARAVELIKKAIDIKPDAAIYHNNLGNAFLNLNNISDALNSFEKAVSLKHDYVEAITSLGIALHKSGRHSDAAEKLRNALEINPAYFPALNNLAIVLKKTGRLKESIKCLRHAIKLKPDEPDLYFNLGNSLYESGDIEKALIEYNNALSIDPSHVMSHNNIANLLKEKKQYDEAIIHYKRAVQINPDFAEAYSNMADAFRETGDFDAAVTACKKAISIDSSEERAFFNLGNIYFDFGHYAEAAENFQKALHIRPDFADAQYNIGLLHLLMANFAYGWKGYAFRFKSREIASEIGYRKDFDHVQGINSLPEGKTILIRSEQGAGDNIQFIRYVKLLRNHADRIIFECPGNLFRLFKHVHEIDELYTDRQKNMKADLNIYLLNLPMIFGTALDTIPCNIPYLMVDEETVEAWKYKIDKDSFNVGITWSGNPAHRNDRNRSCKLSDFDVITSIPGVRLYSLQKGGIIDEQYSIITDLGNEFEDFYDTAAVIMNLDLVISVDTAVVHLAGALGKPVWTLLPYVPDWRWMLDREDSPWYPTMRLFRQTERGDWKSVMHRVANELTALIHQSGKKVTH